MPEKYRGEINGVQNGLNSTMDTIKFALVMALPFMQTFGYLIMASVTAITVGGLFFTLYFWESRNHQVMPEEKEEGEKLKQEHTEQAIKGNYGSIEDR